MATLEQRLTALLEPSIQSLGFELWGLEMIRAGKHSTLRLYIDKAAVGVGIDDCALVSRHVSALLDVDDPIQTEYHLEVSSPGLDRLIFTLPQFELYLGQTIAVQLQMAVKNRRKWQGVLSAVQGDQLILRVDDHDEALAFQNIQKANLVPTFV